MVPITYKQIHKVTFPVYPVPSENWYSQDGLLFVDGQLVDDKNMSGDTLGLRRAQTYFGDLLPLRHSVNNLVALIKQGKKYFIDSKGKCFIYEKTRFCKLKYYRLKRVDLNDTSCLLWVREINFPFNIPRPPKPGYNWVGILHLNGMPWLLYDYADERPRESKRKI